MPAAKELGIKLIAGSIPILDQFVLRNFVRKDPSFEPISRILPLGPNSRRILFASISK